MVVTPSALVVLAQQARLDKLALVALVLHQNGTLRAVRSP